MGDTALWYLTHILDSRTLNTLIWRNFLFQILGEEGENDEVSGDGEEEEGKDE